MPKFTLSQCFPHPFTRQWPSTSSPVNCECQQLYVLVSVCCCVPKAHLLVLHEGVPNDMVTSMPKGPKYVAYQIKARTSPEDLAGFLHRAQVAAIPGPMNSNSGSGGSSRRQSSRPRNELSLSGFFLRRHHESTGVTDKSGNTSFRVQVVVCLQGIEVASPAVLSLLMDVLNHAMVPLAAGPKSVPSLHIVAFCDYRRYVSELPTSVRASFALSTYLSAAALDSAAVLQSINPLSSTIVNKPNMLEVMCSTDGQQLVETVTFTSTVKRYLRHLVLVVRGSTVSELASGTTLIRQLFLFTTLIRVAALLFAPSTELLRFRTGDGRAAQHSLSGAPYSPAEGAGNFTIQHSGENNCSTATIHSFQHVVVSPADVLCLLPALVTHHFTIHHSVVDIRGCMTEAAQRLTGLAIPPPDKDRPSTTKRPWDVNMVMIALQPHPKAAVDTTSNGNADQLDQVTEESVTGDGPPTVTNFPQASNWVTRLESPQRQRAQVSPGERTTWRPEVSGPSPMSVEDSITQSAFLHYGEVRDYLRATLVCYSAPAPG